MRADRARQPAERRGSGPARPDGRRQELRARLEAVRPRLVVAAALQPGQPGALPADDSQQAGRLLPLALQGRRQGLAAGLALHRSRVERRAPRQAVGSLQLQRQGRRLLLGLPDARERGVKPLRGRRVGALTPRRPPLERRKAPLARRLPGQELPLPPPGLAERRSRQLQPDRPLPQGAPAARELLPQPARGRSLPRYIGAFPEAAGPPRRLGVRLDLACRGWALTPVAG